MRQACGGSGTRMATRREGATSRNTFEEDRRYTPAPTSTGTLPFFAPPQPSPQWRSHDDVGPAASFSLCRVLPLLERFRGIDPGRPPGGDEARGQAHGEE